MRRYDDNDIQELKDIVRIGIVSSINKNSVTARVKIPEQGIVTGDLKIIQNMPGVKIKSDSSTSSADFEVEIQPWLPEAGQWVVCLFKPDSEGDGFILGGI